MRRSSRTLDEQPSEAEEDALSSDTSQPAVDLAAEDPSSASIFGDGGHAPSVLARRDEHERVKGSDLAQAEQFRAQSPESDAPGSVETNREELIRPEIFDEAGYLRINPDVRLAVESGQIKSGYDHYLQHGSSEGRSVPTTPQELRNVMLAISRGPTQEHVGTREVRCSIDALIIAPNAGLMVVGWIDDSADPLSCIRITGADWRVVLDASVLVRLRRADVEKAVGGRGQHAFGFFGFLQFDRRGEGSGPIRLELWQHSGSSAALQCVPGIVDELELRNTALGYLAGASYFGNAAIESMAFLGRGIGDELIRFNRTITSRLVTAPYIEQFGPQKSSLRGTIVVCLYGKLEFFFVQNCLFSGLPGIDDYEFVYVCNSPELAEALLREAHSASLMYGLMQRVMILPGNAGFGGANNVAARTARSKRLLMVNPDVFPRDRDWAKKHSELLDAVAPQQARLFSVPLYYDDGSLMHGGMYFEIDVGLSMSAGGAVPHKICRVEHYGKGAPPDSPQFTRPRPVPAVTGAFISIDRSWFEQLDGFNEDYIFGHYEDADLCLKSMGKGTAPWLHDIRMWHLEGKGSIRQPPHEGGSLVNRWLFSRTWAATIEAGLKGSAPTIPLLQTARMPAPFPTQGISGKRPSTKLTKPGRVLA
jgi:GT2 family glycosyltransferase